MLEGQLIRQAFSKWRAVGLGIYFLLAKAFSSAAMTSNRPAILRKSSQQGLSLLVSAWRRAAEDSNQNDAASSSQVRQKDAEMNASARRLAAAGRNQDLDFQASARRLAAQNSEIIDDDDDSEWPNNNHISHAYIPHLEKVYSNLRQKLGRKPGDNMEDLDVNTLLWGMFMTVTLQAAVHLGNDFFGESTFYQTSATTNSETIVRCDKEVDQKAERNSRYIHDQLENLRYEGGHSPEYHTVVLETTDEPQRQRISKDQKDEPILTDSRTRCCKLQ